MGDQWVADKLTSWGLSMYEAMFADEEIDKEAFQCLSEEIMRKIFPKAGPFPIFLSKWTLEFPVVSSGASDIDLRSNNGNNKNAPNTPRDEVDIQEGDFEVDPEDGSLLDFSLIDGADLKSEVTAPIDDLIETLKQDVMGLGILHHYKENHDLTESLRNQLADIVIRKEIMSSPDFTIEPPRLLALATLTTKYLPTEKVETYYIQYYLDEVTKRKILPKGKYHDKYNSVRSFLLENKVTGKIKGSAKRKPTDNSRLACLLYREELKLPKDLTAEEFVQKNTWLQNNIDSWQRVLKLWEQASPGRILELIRDTDNTNYLNIYVCLRHIKDGPQLIDIDFRTQYPDKDLTFFSEYPKLEDKILEYVQKKKKSPAEVKEIYSKILKLKLSEDVDDEELKVLNVCKLLVNLLPCPPITANGSRKSKSTWRPSRVEVWNNFMLVVKDATEMNRSLSERKCTLADYGLKEQLLIVVILKEKIEKRFVCIGNVHYQVDSLMKAIDTAFKSFHALQLEYPKEASYPWIDIQKTIYCIKGEADTDLPCLNTFISDLKRH